MRLPVIHGVIRRRMLVNFRVDPEVMGRYLSPPFRPKIHHGYAIAGICLIRLEEIRFGWVPKIAGMFSENAAHRIAVEWRDPSGDERQGVFIPRRDTGSWINHVTGGRVFPGEHHLADFEVTDDGANVSMAVRVHDGTMALELKAHETDAFPSSSCFQSLEDSSSFFEGGSVGYSVTREPRRLDGIKLQVEGWRVRPLAVDHVRSSFFEDEAIFPKGSAVFDHALIMRDIEHEWHSEADLFTERAMGA